MTGSTFRWPTDDAAAVDPVGAARSAILALETMQVELTAALVASQDQIHAMKTLAQIIPRSAASGQTVELLLEKSLGLTRSTLILLFEDDTVIASSGQLEDLSENTAIALHVTRTVPRSALRSAAGDRVMIATVDPDGAAELHLAFFRPQGQQFSTADIPLLEATVSALGVMRAFNTLHERELARAVIENEHRLASALAQSMIVEDPPTSARIDFFAKTVPASLTGGDFYVFGQSDDMIWFAVGDVAGKGLPAAMIMTRAVAACRVAFSAERRSSVTEVMSRVEDELFEFLDDAGVFVTITLGLFDERTGTVSFGNAGHSPVVVVRDGVADFIPASVPPFGVLRNRVPEIVTIVLGELDCLVVGSDGLVEQSNASGELFGYDHFLDLCQVTCRQSSELMGDQMFDSVRAFAAGMSPVDDCTLVILKSRAG